MSFQFIRGNALHIPLRDNSVHCVVTSPPYWGLRDYSTKPQIWPSKQTICDGHEWTDLTYIRNNDKTAGRKQQTNIGSIGRDDPIVNSFCSKCGTWRGQLGLEPTIELYIEHMLLIFREVKRVLRNDGTLWLNIGDSYNSQSASNGISFRRDRASVAPDKSKRGNGRWGGLTIRDANLKPKDLCGIPWRVAFSLQNDGWYLRSDIIYSKPNAMPESVSDRPAKAHEYIFLLTKSSRYYFDQEAIKEPAEYDGRKDTVMKGSKKYKNGLVPNQSEQTFHARGNERWQWNDSKAYRNRRSVWTIPTEPFSGAHFSTFPQELPRICIAAGTSEMGCCPKCGAPWKREIKPSEEYQKYLGQSWTDHNKEQDALNNLSQQLRGNNRRHQSAKNDGITCADYITIGWQPTCYHGTEHPIPPVSCVVLDPFCGSGTAVAVAHKMGRHGIGIELSEKYLTGCAQRRMEKAGTLL